MKKLSRIIASGFIGFWIPILIILLLFEKMFHVIHKAIIPFETHLPVLHFFGITSLVILVVLLMLVLCFLGGLLIRLNYIRKEIKTVENTILNRIPGYSTFKVMFDNETQLQENITWHAVLVAEEEDHYTLGYTTYSSEHYYVVHRVTTPSIMDTELFIIPKRRVILLNISSQEFMQHVKRVKNTAELVEKVLNRADHNGDNCPNKA